MPRKNRLIAEVTLAGVMIVLTLSCGGGGDKNTPSAPVDNSVASVSVTPTASLSLVSGATASLTATALNRSGVALAGQVATWSSTDATIASVVAGVVTARLVGSASITAQIGGISSAPIPVTVSPGAPTQLGVRTAAGGAASGIAFTTQPVVEIRDAAGNVVPSSALAVTAALGSGGGTLGGAATVSATAGVATFSGLVISGIVGSRTLTFSATGVSPVTSAAFTLTRGTDAASVLTEFYNQRGFEFYLEGKRLADLRRQPAATLYVPATGATYFKPGFPPIGNQTCYPLPKAERDSNPNFKKP